MRRDFRPLGVAGFALFVRLPGMTAQRRSRRNWGTWPLAPEPDDGGNALDSSGPPKSLKKPPAGGGDGDGDGDGGPSPSSSRLFNAAAKSLIAPNNRRTSGNPFTPNRVKPWLGMFQSTDGGRSSTESSPKARSGATDDDDDRAACDTAGFELAQHCAVGGGGAPTAEEAKDERALTCGGDGVDEARSDDNGGDLLAPRPLGPVYTGTSNSMNWSSWSGRDRRFRQMLLQNGDGAGAAAIRDGGVDPATEIAELRAAVEALSAEVEYLHLLRQPGTSGSDERFGWRPRV